jgi:hypothetical protein
MMFLETAGLLATGGQRQLGIHNALVESFTVHARVLLNVFYPAKPWPDDVLAKDFLDDPGTWEHSRPPLSPLLADVERRVGKEVAHLTYARLAVTPEQKQWRYHELARDMRVVVVTFINLVPSSRLDAEWRDFEKALGVSRGA